MPSPWRRSNTQIGSAELKVTAGVGGDYLSPCHAYSPESKTPGADACAFKRLAVILQSASLFFIL